MEALSRTVSPQQKQSLVPSFSDPDISRSEYFKPDTAVFYVPMHPKVIFPSATKHQLLQIRVLFAKRTVQHMPLVMENEEKNVEKIV